MSIGGNLSETDRMKRRIAVAFDALEAPDSARLATIENVLASHVRTEYLRQQKRRDRLWWLAGLLMLGTAAAGWWAGKHYFARPTTVQPPAALQLPVKGLDTIEQVAPVQPAKPQATDRPPPRSPVIYRREGR